MRRRLIAGSVVAGVVLAGVYTLAPLVVWSAAMGGVALALAGRDLPDVERRFLSGLLVLALAARVGAITGIFLANIPTHDDQFVGATTGDEAYTEARALRTRAIVLGEGGNKYDYFVAYDEYGRNSYVTLL